MTITTHRAKNLIIPYFRGLKKFDHRPSTLFSTREPANLAFQSVPVSVCVLVFVFVPLFLTAPLRKAQRDRQRLELSSFSLPASTLLPGGQRSTFNNTSLFLLLARLLLLYPNSGTRRLAKETIKAPSRSCLHTLFLYVLTSVCTRQPTML